MNEVLNSAILLLIGGLITGAGFLIRRWLVGDRSNERVNKWATLAGLASQLKSGQITVDDIHALERAVDGKTLKIPNPTVSSRVETQAEMNSAAALELAKLDLELQSS